MNSAIAVGRGWSVAWTGEHNGTTEVLVGVEKDGVGAVAGASVHLDARSEDKRVQLLGATLAAARARLGGGRNLRVIVAGDMNAEFKVGSALGAVVSPEDGDAADALRACTVALRHSPDASELERCSAAFAQAKELLGRIDADPAMWRQAEAEHGHTLRLHAWPHATACREALRAHARVVRGGAGMPARRRQTSMHAPRPAGWRRR